MIEVGWIVCVRSWSIRLISVELSREIWGRMRRVFWMRGVSLSAEKIQPR